MSGSFLKGLAGIVGGLFVMFFGGLLLSVGGYGATGMVYAGIVWAGILITIVAPVIYWVVPGIQRLVATV